MKKIISIIMALVLVAATVSLCAFAQENEPDLKIAIASDLHYNIPREKLEGQTDQPLQIEDPIYWYANRRCAMEDESGFIIDEFLRQCAQDDSIEYVLIPGDLVDNGKSIIQEHYDVAEKLRRFEEESGKSVFVINGNHDAGDNSATTFDQFMEIYADFGYDLALDRHEGTCSYTADLGDKYRLIALDSCHASYSTEDGMTNERVNWVVDMAEKAKEEGRYPVLMMHHNLLDHLPMQRIVSRNFIIRNHTVTAAKFANAGIKIVYSGHEHCSDAAVYTSALGNKIYDFATTSLTMYPLEYRVFSFNEEEITYEARAIDSIDLDALTAVVDGYSDEQLELMAAGLNDYARGFLKVSIQYRLALGMTMEKMGIEEGAIYYDLVYTVINTLTSALESPLYGEGSVSEQMAEYGITIPESKYENGWDLATDLVAAHYSGEENYPVFGDEVAILLRTVAFILREELSLFTGDTLSAASDALIADMDLASFTPTIDAVGKSVFGTGITDAEYFITALISPLLYEFANDTDGVPDNNGTTEGYGTVNAETRWENFVEKIRSFMAKLSYYVEMIMGVFAKMGK